MKLEVSHKEIVAGLTQFLASQGITGFDPATCQVTFSQKRGTGELSAVLDTDPAPEVPKEEKPATKPAAAATATGAAASGAAATTEVSKEEPKVDLEAQAAAAEQAAIDTASGVEPEGAATAGGDDDNLFD